MQKKKEKLIGKEEITFLDKISLNVFNLLTMIICTGSIKFYHFPRFYNLKTYCKHEKLEETFIMFC
jgi:hypothetical protein